MKELADLIKSRFTIEEINETLGKNNGNSTFSHKQEAATQIDNIDVVEKEDKETQAQLLLKIAAKALLFHTEDEEAFAQFQVNEHLETRAIRSKGFTLWLTKEFYEKYSKPPSSQALKDTLSVLEANALFDSRQDRVFTRIAEYDNAIYVDLCNENWEAVQITEDGWKVVVNPPVKFVRSKIMTELPKPVNGGDINELKPFLNYRTEGDWMLIVAWLLAALRPGSPYPILTIQGEQGSAKSTTTKILKSLIDPSSLLLRALPSDERDLSIAAKNTWLLAFDNLSGVSNPTSDALCKLSTGGGLATRKLYSDDEETIFNVMRPAILNGIDDIAKRQDLLDRSLVLFLPSIPSNNRTDEKSFWNKFEEIKPRLLGALFDVISGILIELPNIRLIEKPRMADFALWVTAAESALKWHKGSFMEAYYKNRNDAIEQGLESDPIGVTVQLFMKNREIWEGTAEMTLRHLSNYIGDDRTKYTSAWPTSRKLKECLRRIAPALRVMGIEYTDLGRKSQGASLKLEKVKESSTPTTFNTQGPSVRMS